MGLNSGCADCGCDEGHVVPTPGCETDCKPKCLCNGCRTCGSCGCAPPEPKRFLRCRVKVQLSASDRAITLPASCVCDDAEVDLSKLWLWVRRRGQSEWALRYPAWETDDYGGILFLFDDQLQRLPPGRYEGELRYRGCACETIELDLRRKCPPRVTRVETVREACMTFPSFQGGFPVFESVQGFTAELCGVLEKGVRSLPLCGADKTRLCAATLCKPVQLVLCDGVRTEIIEFSGCTDDQILVDRGMGGTTQRRFPPGTKVSFEWTEANIAGVMAPCGDCNTAPLLGDLQCR